MFRRTALWQSSYGVIVYATTLVPLQKGDLLLLHAAALNRPQGTIRSLRTTGQSFILRPNTGIPSGTKCTLACIQDSEEERKNVETGFMPDSDRARNPRRAYCANVFDHPSGKPINAVSEWETVSDTFDRSRHFQVCDHCRLAGAVFGKLFCNSESTASLAAVT